MTDPSTRLPTFFLKAVYNGTIGVGFGRRFHPANDQLPPPAIAA